MHITQQQEQFSNAYLKMVATLAECTLSKPEVDDDSIDFSIKTKNYIGVFRESPTKNEQTVTVSIPQANRLTPYELRYLMQIVASGGAP